MGGFWMDKEIQDQLNLWLSRILVLSSFAAHLALALFAEVRRSDDSGGARRKLVWWAYQVSDMAPKAALGKLYLDSPSDHQLLFAFWVPFLLLHLGLADNISAYSLEDNKLSLRKIAEIFLQLGGAVYGAYKQRFMSGDRVLCPAFVIMFLLGLYKCGEMPFALRRGGFTRIRSCYEDKEAKRFSPAQTGTEDLDDDYALSDAHGLLGITMGAFADYSVKGFKENPEDRSQFSHPDRRISYTYWYDVVKVVEMELSLMYDMMYTKAAVIHTRRGYIVRFLSPPLTFTAFLLFLFHSKAGQEAVDIKITYTLLIGTFVLDVRWLLRSLVSTWTYAFLQGTQCNLLKKTICCRRGIWYGLRRLVFSLDPCRLRISISKGGCLKLNKQIGSHRMWSRTIGQHNLLQECTGGTRPKKIEWEGKSGIRSILRVICEKILKQILAPSSYARPADDLYKLRRTFGDARLFGPEFDELVLTWHIATDVFLLCTPGSETSPMYCKIKAISNYLMFLVAQRPKMVPGLKLNSHYKDIKEALMWSLKSMREDEYEHVSGCGQGERKLAYKLRDMGSGELGGMSTMLSEATQYAKVLGLLCVPGRTGEMNWDAIQSQVQMGYGSERRLLILVPEFYRYALEGYEQDKLMGWSLEVVLLFILRSWVNLLIFASIRCSRDSHAEKLSCGGELTTVVWILVEHSLGERVSYRNQIQNND